MSDTLRSYQVWKGGRREHATALAGKIDGPLGQAMTSWYDELNRRATTSSVHASAGAR
ncbi:hypothetical protein [Streptomyces sp. NPDC046385]|uniref:hypothetical protein n=1 Tax=Streptomyces sp. NPDC046385 TaxID=3154918 RepID=UPI0033C89E7B